MQFEPGEREYLDNMRSLSTDLDGNVVFVGLNVEESEFYLAYSRAIGAEHGSAQTWKQRETERVRYLELHERTERERLAVVGAEIVASVEKPTLN